MGKGTCHPDPEFYSGERSLTRLKRGFGMTVSYDLRAMVFASITD